MSKSYVNLQNGSDVLATMTTGSCAANKAVYKISGFKPLGGSLFIPDLVPLKAPCNYGLEIYMSLIDAANAIVSYRQLGNANQPSPGSSIGFTNNAAYITQSITGTSLAVTKNASKDSLDFNWTLGGGYAAYNYYVEIQVTNPTNF